MKFVLNLCLVACFIAALQAAAVEPSTTKSVAHDVPTTVTAEDATNDYVPDVCYQPKEIGRCFGIFPRFAFNLNNRRCEKFVYGGCDGNSNNFESKAACESVCLYKHDELSDEDSSTTENTSDDAEPAPVIPADEQPAVAA
nr:kunitz-type protease inhibitor 2 [Bactrocera oleae]